MSARVQRARCQRSLGSQRVAVIVDRIRFEITVDEFTVFAADVLQVLQSLAKQQQEETDV